MKKKLTVTVAIAAYNAEKNIRQLVQSITDQKETSFVLKSILVNSDQSTDATVAIAKKANDPRVKVITSKTRRGFAGSFVSLLKKNNSDVIMMLNDDILITDRLFIEKSIAPFLKEKNVGLVCSNPQPIRTGNFVERAVVSSFNAYEKVRTLRENGNTVLTCDGKTLTLSKAFIRSIKFPKDLSEMANVDWFIFFSCLDNGFSYRFAENARVYFKCPTTIRDYIKWTTRNNIDQIMMEKRFGELYTRSFTMPKARFIYYKLAEGVKNPAGCLLLFSMSIYCAIKARMHKGLFETKWDLVSTTKIELGA